MIVHTWAGALASTEAVAEARNFSESAGYPAGLTARLAIIVEELVANILEHGDAPPDAPIRLGLEATPDGLLLLLEDRGGPFDLAASDGADAVPERGGGAGVRLVKSWAQILSYSRVDGWNRLELLLPVASL